MKSFHMMDIEALDVQIVNEMKALGYETGTLLQELKAGQMNPRTAAYKMLKRARTTEELLHWQDTVKSVYELGAIERKLGVEVRHHHSCMHAGVRASGSRYVDFLT